MSAAALEAGVLFSSSFAFPSFFSLGVTILGEMFASVTVFFLFFIFYFFIPTTDVVTLRLRGWCMLGVFCCRHSMIWDMNVRIFFFSPCDGMRVCTD